MKLKLLTAVLVAAFAAAWTVDAQNFVVYKGKQVIQQYQKPAAGTDFSKVKAKFTVETYVVFDIDGSRKLDTSVTQPSRIVIMKTPAGYTPAKIQMTPYLGGAARPFTYYAPATFTFIQPYEAYFGDWAIEASGGATDKSYTVLYAYDTDPAPVYGLSENYIGQVKVKDFSVPSSIAGSMTYFDEAVDTSVAVGVDVKSKFTFNKNATAAAVGATMADAVSALSVYLDNGGRGYVATWAAE